MTTGDAGTAIDEARRKAFVRRTLADTSGTMATVLAVIGDRLGLFKDLAAAGPATSGQLASRTGIVERYAREWLGGMAAAGYLEYDPATAVFTLPPEHVPVLAEEGGAYFLGGLYQMLPDWVARLDAIASAFRDGGGVPQSAYGKDTWDGLERYGAGWVEHLLVSEWISRMPDVEARLAEGARVADVGCGRGRAIIRLARAFPSSTYVGYDVFGPSVDAARGNAEAAGVGDRVSFEQRDVAQGLPEPYDVITTFDVLHDAVDPRGLLHTIRAALRADGIYVCLDMNCSDRLEENLGPLGTLFHGFSVLYCLTTSLAHGGEGLGTVGLPESKLRELSLEAGFSSVRRVEMRNRFSSLYEVRP
jgi:SAM-dependent methyltransferase